MYFWINNIEYSGEVFLRNLQVYFPGDPILRGLSTTTTPLRFQEGPLLFSNPKPTPSPIHSPDFSPSHSPGFRPLHSPDLSPIHNPDHIPDLSPLHSPPSGHHSSIIPSQCGTPILGNRVIGGTLTEPGEWPWLAALGLKRASRFVSRCGGTLFTARHVLSAQHCFNGPVILDTVRLGEYDLKRLDDVPHTQDFGIAQRFSHDYDPATYENDIVILVLDREVVFTDYIQPVCLPFDQLDNEYADDYLMVVGWGKTDFKTENYPDVPLEASVPVVSRTRCAQSYSRFAGRQKPVIDARQLCAGNGTTDSCGGDSGGPLHYLNLDDGRYYLVGIVSFGYQCANSDYPGVYTRVASFLTWIVEKINVQ
ncbi:CLIP domain-containing serine protease 2 [Chionoecetes opilio]|uniref:CLIP domain-containing serine protease 2 n=1 Tax=Chionoecetes opilio TaxID=41210 RepID=A0A8J4YD28_CHIOP|nr:CLIP domain-containing serine protease 2 [Chionoecetes opilio]